jgi:hypothetical protein
MTLPVPDPRLSDVVVSLRPPEERDLAAIELTSTPGINGLANWGELKVRVLP